MNDKNHKTEYFQAVDQDTYRTGSTNPPRSHNGFIAFLLGMVILLCGIVTLLGLLNIQPPQLFDAAPEATQPAVAFSRSNQLGMSASVQTPLGFTGETITDFWHTYHELPRGVFIQNVSADSDAARKGIMPGDILISINGIRVTSTEELNAVLAACQPDQPVSIQICREDRHYYFQLTIDERN